VRLQVGQLNHLGNMFVMKAPADSPAGAITVRIEDHSGNSYGTFDVKFSCGDGACGVSADAPATKVA
jgi:hypothetical protein